MYIPKLSGDVKSEYVKEIKSVVFTGSPVKPSAVIQATHPKHAEKEIVVIAADDMEWKEKIPKIWDISTLDEKAEKKALEMKV